MRFSVPTLSHTFLRMGLFVVLASVLLTPLAPILAQGLDFGPDVPPVDTTGFSSGVQLDYGNIGNYSATNPDGLGWSTGGASPVSNPDINGDGFVTSDEVQTTQQQGNQTSPQEAHAYAMAESESWVHNTIITIGGWIAGVGGNVFEISFDTFVVRLGCLFVQNGGPECTGDDKTFSGINGKIGGVVNALWTVIRDLFNLALIFSLIYIGFRMILNADDSGARKSLSYLIYAALLVNFSLYLAKLVVDISNFTAMQIYEQMMTDGSGTFGINGLFELKAGAGNNVAGAFMEVLRVASWFNVQIDTGGGTFSYIAFAVMALIFLIYLGAIFLYGAFMMMSRFIAITILLIFSPAMFLGWVLPSFKSYSDKWRAMFVAYCFFAPVYVFMLYLSLYTLLQLSASMGNKSYGDSFTGDGSFKADSMGIFVFFFVGTGLLFASTKVAAHIASSGAGATMNMASNWAKKFSVGAAAVGGGYLAGAGLGRAGKGFIAASEAVEARTGKSNFATRASRAYGDSLKKKKVGGAPSFQEYRDYIEKEDKRAGGLKKQNDNLAILSEVTPANIADRERVIAKLSGSDVVAMAKTKAGKAALEKNADLLRPEQIKALNEDKEIDSGDRKAIIDNRSTKLKAEFNTGEKIKKANDDQLASLDKDFLAQEEYAINLTEAKIDKMPQFVASEKVVLKTKRKEALKKVIHDNVTIGGITAASLAGKPVDDITSLPDEVLNPGEPTLSAQQKTNVENFVASLNLNFMGAIQNKKGKDIAINIRAVLQNQANTGNIKIRDWLDKDRIGMNFGV